MKKISLGYTPAWDEPTPVKAADDERKPRVYHPSVTIEGKPAKQLIKKLSAGDTVEAMVTLKVRRVTESEADGDRAPTYPSSDCSISCDLMDISIQGMGDMDDEEMKVERAEDAMDGYFKKKSGMAEEEEEEEEE